MNLILVIILVASMNSANNIRTMGGFVTEVNSEYVCITTEDENEWIIDNDSQWNMGDIVIVIFDTMDTDSIYDDEIVHVVATGGNWLGSIPSLAIRNKI